MLTFTLSETLISIQDQVRSCPVFLPDNPSKSIEISLIFTQIIVDTEGNYALGISPNHLKSFSGTSRILGSPV
jgi:hypothetical protein